MAQTIDQPVMEPREEHSKEPSTLLMLPDEILQLVYELFYSTTTIQARSDENQDGKQSFQILNSKEVTALLLTCRSVYDVARPFVGLMNLSLTRYKEGRVYSNIWTDNLHDQVLYEVTDAQIPQMYPWPCYRRHPRIELDPEKDDTWVPVYRPMHLDRWGPGGMGALINVNLEHERRQRERHRRVQAQSDATN